MMDTNFYTYVHCKPNGDPFYVGKGCGQRSHKLTVGRSLYHQRVVAKYGEKNIGVYVFPCNSEEQALEDETQQIVQLRSEGWRLANLTDGGSGGRAGLIHSIETRRKLSISLSKAYESQELRAQRSAEMRGNKNALGKKLSAESRAKLSAALSGRKMSAETILKRSATVRGRKHSPETIEKMAAVKRGKPVSAETRAKLSAANLGKRRNFVQTCSPETRIKMRASAMGNRSALGHRLSDEAKAKISAANKRRYGTGE
mgnify:FL=1